MSTETIQGPDVPAGLLALQEEVPAKLIGKLPKVTCANCRKKENRGQCGEHKKETCRVCKGWLTPAHTHLDYVGHAETTSKLLEVDPLWNWEPLAFGDDGLPTFDANGGLWIRLTVCGVTRLGYGTADNAGGFKSTGDIKKEIIGDAIRNAAMRYGWALNLWAKADIHERTPQEHEQPRAGVREPKAAQAKSRAQRGPQDNAEWEQEPPEPESTKGQHIAISKLFLEKCGVTSAQRDRKLAGVRYFLGVEVPSTAKLSHAQATRLIEVLSALPPFAGAPSEAQQASAAAAEAQRLAPGEPSKVERAESDLRDRIEAAESAGELDGVIAAVLDQSGWLSQEATNSLLSAADLRGLALGLVRQGAAS